MLRHFQKVFVRLSLVTMITGTLISPRSNAIVGLGGGGAGYAIGGIALLVAGGSIAQKSFDRFLQMDTILDGLVGLGGGYVGLAIGWVGVIFLDGENGRQLDFGPLTIEDAQKMQIDLEDRNAYMRELPMIRVAAVAASGELRGSELKAENREQIAAVLQRYFSGISPSAFAVVKTLSVNAVSQF